jgi:hypothetical protein
MWDEGKLQLNLESDELKEWRTDVAEYVAQPLDLALQKDMLGNPIEFAVHLAQVFFNFPLRKKQSDPMWVGYIRFRLEQMVPIITLDFRDEGPKVFYRRAFRIRPGRVMYAGSGEVEIFQDVLDIIEEKVKPFRDLMKKRLAQAMGGSRDAFWIKFGEVFFMSLFHFDSLHKDPGAITSFFINYLEFRLGGRRNMRVVEG